MPSPTVVLALKGLNISYQAKGVFSRVDTDDVPHHAKPDTQIRVFANDFKISMHTRQLTGSLDTKDCTSEGCAGYSESVQSAQA